MRGTLLTLATLLLTALVATPTATAGPTPAASGIDTAPVGDISGLGLTTGPRMVDLAPYLVVDNSLVGQQDVTRESAPGPMARPTIADSVSMLSSALQLPEPRSALADADGDESGSPLADLNYLSVTPSGFALVRGGRPTGKAATWTHTVDTALSYVRPHRNLQFVVQVHGDENPRPGTLASNVLQVTAQLVDNMKVQVDSRSIRSGSALYGTLDPKADNKSHPGRMATFGIDLGLLPAILADVGINTTITVGESSNPGPYVAVATNVEVPNEPARERSIDSEFQAPTDLLVGGTAGGAGVSFASGFAGGGVGGTSGGGGGDTPTPIKPEEPEEPVPEPGTMLLLGAGAAIILARRRMKA